MDASKLFISHRGPISDYYSIYARFDLDPTAWLAPVTKIKLKLFCLADAGNSWTIWSGVELDRLNETWFPPAPGIGAWPVFCERDLPEMTFGYDYSGVSPATGQWYELDITGLCQGWSLKLWPNLGLCLREFWMDQDAVFAGVGYADPAYRPRLRISQVGGLALKMPLPGGPAWRLTTEAGGGDCPGKALESSHTGVNHHSLDFSPASLVDGVVRIKTDVTVCAAGPGVVTIVSFTSGNGH